MKVASSVARALLGFLGFSQVFWPGLFSDSWFNFAWFRQSRRTGLWSKQLLFTA